VRTEKPAPTAKPAPAGAVGMVVGIDPETGVLGPATAEQRLELLQLLPEEQNMLSRSTVGLVERRLPDGGVLLDDYAEEPIVLTKLTRKSS